MERARRSATRGFSERHVNGGMPSVTRLFLEHINRRRCEELIGSAGFIGMVKWTCRQENIKVGWNWMELIFSRRGIKKDSATGEILGEAPQ